MKTVGKSPKKTTCVYEGEFVHMKGKKERVLTKTDGGFPRKKAGRSPKNATCVYEGEYVHMKKTRKGF